jgi:hypothetical protein
MAFVYKAVSDRKHIPFITLLKEMKKRALRQNQTYVPQGGLHV